MRNVLARVQRGNSEMVAAVIRTIFAQPDAEHGPARPAVDQLQGQRFNRTLRTERAYATAWTSNDQRTAALDACLKDYNTARSHSALGGRPPISRLAA